MNLTSLVVAIDGPAGAGKSTVAKMVAADLGLSYLDTGAMYRCVALLAEAAGITAEMPGEAEKLAEGATIRFQPGDPPRVLIGDEDVTDRIRTPSISQLASSLSAISGVRKHLARRQKELVAAGGVVLEGRDTTSVIAPEAPVKIFLTASLEERAERRHKELIDRGTPMELGALMREIAERDHRDYTREDSPMARVPGAHVIETFGLSPRQVADRILTLVRDVVSESSSTSL